MTPKAIIYIRVSTSEQVENLSLTTQERVCRRFCESNGFAVDRVFREEGESAKSMERTQFIKMVGYLGNKGAGIRYLVIYNVSRLTRNAGDYHQIAALLASRGIGIRSATEQLSETPEGFLMSGMLALLAEFDNRQKAQRTMAGMKTAIEAGKWTHGAPLGYLPGGRVGGVEGPSLVHDPVRAPLVRMAFEQIATGLYSQTEVLDKVTAAGLTGRNGGPLSPQSFNKLLRKPLYAARIVVKNLGENPRGNFEPIVPPEVFDRAQAALQRGVADARPKSRDNPDFPLRVFVHCAECNTPITGSWSTGRHGKRYGHYTCRKKGCRAVKIRKELFESTFIAHLRQLKPKAQFLRMFREIVVDVWRERDGANVARVGALEQQAAEVKQKLEQLEEAYVCGTKSIEPDTYRRLSDKFRQQLLLVDMELRNEQTDGYSIEAVLQFAEHLMSDAAEMWLAASLEERRRIQNLLFPSGVSFDGFGFRTDVTCPLFEMLQSAERGHESLASPRGFEADLSSFDLDTYL